MSRSNRFRFGVSSPLLRCIVVYRRICVGDGANASGRRVYSSKAQLQDSVAWFTPIEMEGMSRRELQRWCKKLGIRANSKTIQLRTDLLAFHRDVLSRSSILKYPFLPAQIPAQLGVSTVSNDRGLFVYRNPDVIRPSNWADTNVCSTRGVRHYNKTCDLDEVIHLGDTDCARLVSDKKLPSVSGILRATTPKDRLFGLFQWTKKQKELLGEEVFRQQIKEIKKNGFEFHRFIHLCLVDRSLNTKGPARLEGYLESTKEVFKKLGDAIASEKSVRHSYLGYQGRVDTVACYEGDPSIIEWKTSKKKKSSLEECHDYPLQVVAYAGAVNSDPCFGFQVKQGLIVVAYEDGSPADVHRMDLQLCRTLWQDWLMRIFKFQNQAECSEDKNKK